jgi:NADH:ubiquinone oxidoreductase subunit E
MKNTMKICMGSSCFARGNEENLRIAEDFAKANSPDVEIELFGLRCENKCERGPVIIVNDVEHGGVTPLRLEKLLAELQNG